MVQEAMADGRDLTDDSEYDRLEPEALLGCTNEMAKRFKKKLPWEAREWRAKKGLD